ncbi:MAG: hypothetical protein ACREQQ_11060, partial [Candidatus Binatia bacterium]
MPKTTKQLMEESLSDRLPIDVLPVSNEEFIPPEPTREQRAIMQIAREETEAAARKLGMSRRKFLQTGAATMICLGAINKVMGTRGGYYAWGQDSCGLNAPIGTRGQPTYFDLEHPGAQMNNLPGEFIMDLQTHHVVPSVDWYAQNPGEAAFFVLAWNQSSCGEIDRNECLGRFHYMKELFLDSSTNVTILSAVPWRPDGQPLPISDSIETSEIVRTLAGGTRRTFNHKFVMPNRGYGGHNTDPLFGALGQEPLFFQEEMDLMTAAAAQYGQNDGYLRAWKVYTPWGDVPNVTGWWLDDPVGLKFLGHVKKLAADYDMPALVCAHKGFALPSFDQEKAATRDVGVVARDFPEVTFIIYHSGYDGDGPGLGGPFNQGTSASGPYPGETSSPSTSRGVDNFITALRENGWSARHFAPGGSPGTPLAAGEAPASAAHANVPNVYAELGSVWGSVMNSPARASWLLGKLIYYLGPKRVVWGTDALWGGSPQGLVQGLRSFNMSEEAKQKYNLPYGIDGDVDDPTELAVDPKRSIRNGILGRNAAVPYRIDPDAALAAIQCDDVQTIRNQYLLNPIARHDVHGPRTRRELFAALA